jgi:hypothetical protein
MVTTLPRCEDDSVGRSSRASTCVHRPSIRMVATCASLLSRSSPAHGASAVVDSASAFVHGVRIVVRSVSTVVHCPSNSVLRGALSFAAKARRTIGYRSSTGSSQCAVDSLSSPATTLMTRMMTVIIRIMTLVKTGHRVPPRALTESTQMMTVSIPDDDGHDRVHDAHDPDDEPIDRRLG